jgi:hypothetical protein
MNETDETLKLAMEALNTTESDCGSRAWEREQEAITAIKQALAAPTVQEPVAQSLIKALTHAVEIAEAKRPGTWDDLLQYRVLLNTPPAQRQWDYDTLYAAWHAVGADVAGLKWETFVAKLKEKNT